MYTVNKHQDQVDRLDVASVRLTEEERKFLASLVDDGIYASISDALKAGIYQLMMVHQLKAVTWKTRADVRAHFDKRPKNLQGLEDVHDEDD
jgi:Arc/MetJ-type ribon-helix-helix transcriptional regulator